MLASLSLAAGCSHWVPADAGMQQAASQLTPVPLALPASPPVYVLQTGDTIEFKFFYAPDLNETVIIRPDGKISLQLIGELKAAGRTPAELEAEAVRLYSSEMHDPEVSVIVRKFTEPLAYIGGEVMLPGKVVLNRPTSVLQAILGSGGFTDGAERRNVVVLRNGSNLAEPVFISLNLRDHIAGVGASSSPPCSGEECQQMASAQIVGDIYLQANDVVFIPGAQISQLADFFEQYVNQILPIYKNMGFLFTYELSDNDNNSNSR